MPPAVITRAAGGSPTLHPKPLREATMATMVTADQIYQETGLDLDALRWLAAAGRISDADQDGRWDVDAVLAARKLMAGLRRAPRNGHPRWRTDPAEVARQVAEQERDQARSEQVVTRELSDDIVEVRNGHGAYLGAVVHDQTLTGQPVWFIQPPSRESHANVWDLPHAPTRGEAIRSLTNGTYTL